jgi:hypothetical protein
MSFFGFGRENDRDRKGADDRRGHRSWGDQRAGRQSTFTRTPRQDHRQHTGPTSRNAGRTGGLSWTSNKGNNGRHKQGRHGWL